MRTTVNPWRKWAGHEIEVPHIPEPGLAGGI
jgi:hypothetical protein